MKVYILAPLHETGINWLRAHEGVEVVTYDMPEVKNWHEDADAIIVRGNKVSAEDMDNAPNLKCISKHGIGMDVIDVEHAKEKGIFVCNTPTESVEAVAEHAIALMMAVSRRVVINDRRVHEDKVREGSVGGKLPMDSPLIGCELYGKTLGLLGFGRIAIRAGEICRKGFGMNIRAYAPDIKIKRWAGADFAAERYEDLAEMVEGCDYISCHLPINAKNRDMINAEILKHCKPNCIIVNTGRGGVVNEHDLYEALKNGQIQGAASDVYEQEPPDPANPLFTLPNFVATPHMGVNTIEALIRQSESSCKNVYNALTGHPEEIPGLIVNPLK